MYSLAVAFLTVTLVLLIVVSSCTVWPSPSSLSRQFLLLLLLFRHVQSGRRLPHCHVSSCCCCCCFVMFNLAVAFLTVTLVLDVVVVSPCTVWPSPSSLSRKFLMLLFRHVQSGRRLPHCHVSSWCCCCFVMYSLDVAFLALTWVLDVDFLVVVVVVCCWFVMYSLAVVFLTVTLVLAVVVVGSSCTVWPSSSSSSR